MAVALMKAAEAGAQYGNRLAKTEATPSMLRWMACFNLAATIAVLFKMVLK